LSSEKGFEGFLKICEPPLARRAAGGVPGMGGAKENTVRFRETGRDRRYDCRGCLTPSGSVLSREGRCRPKAGICLFRGRTRPAILPRNCYRFSTVKGKIARQAVPAALCAVTSPPRRCVLASAETLRGRQCPFPLYDASQSIALRDRFRPPVLL